MRTAPSQTHTAPNLQAPLSERRPQIPFWHRKWLRGNFASIRRAEISRRELGGILALSRLYLGGISAVSRRYLGFISAVSPRCLDLIRRLAGRGGVKALARPIYVETRRPRCS